MARLWSNLYNRAFFNREVYEETMVVYGSYPRDQPDPCSTMLE